MSTTFIIGLRRSGTTVFWRWFRQDPRFTCFDEPFSEQLLALPADHPKRIWAEFRVAVHDDPDGFWQRYAPIHRADELQEHLTAEQRTYLTWLLERGERTVLDLTRCHLKLRELAALAPDATVLHLVRDERAFASSHLVPSRTDPIGRLRAVAHRRTFWTRRTGFDFWGMEALIGTAPQSHFGRLLTADGFDASGFYQLPAVGKLLVVHRFFTRRADVVGRATFGERFARVAFEDFAARPAGCVADACQRVGIEPPVSDGSVAVQEASSGHRPDDVRWRQITADVDAVCPAPSEPVPGTTP